MSENEQEQPHMPLPRTRPKPDTVEDNETLEQARARRARERASFNRLRELTADCNESEPHQEC